jgi:hypothetical protein
MKDGNKQKVIKAQDKGGRENTTKGNGEQMGNSKESLGKHRKWDRRGSGEDGRRCES